MFNNLELAFFFKQLHYLLKRGISLYPALELIYSDNSNKALKKTIRTILEALREGETFSEILHLRIGIPLFISNMLQIGENEGTLANALEKASQYIERKMDLTNKVKTALAYPTVLVVLALGILTWINIRILPQFKIIYEDAGIKLPLPTQIIFETHLFLAHYWWTFPLSVAITAIIIYLLWRKELPLFLARIVFVFPVAGTLHYYFTMMNFVSNLGSLHHSGLSLMKSLQLTKEATPNIWLKGKLESVQRQLIEGEKLSVALSQTQFFPAIIIKMIMTGEETAQLDTILMHLTDYLSDELEIELNRFISLIGPVSLVIIGAFIAFISVSFLLPLFSMSSTIHYAPH